MIRRSSRSAAYRSVSEGGLEPPHPRRVDLQRSRSEHERGRDSARSARLRHGRNRSIVDAVNTVIGLVVVVGLLLTGACTATGSVHTPTRTGGFPARTYAPSANAWQLNAFLSTIKADGGTSVLLPSGKVLWLFGDRLTADGRSFMGRNAAATQHGSTFIVLAGEFQPSTAGAWYWPGAAVMDAGRLVVLWSERVADGSDFGAQGRTLAISYDPVTLTKTGETDVSGSVGGSSAVKVGSTWHIFGTRAVAGQYGKAVVEWTVPAGQFGDLGRWSTGTTILPATWGAGTDVAVVKEGAHLRLYTKRFDIVGSDIVTAANKAAGGWTAPTVVKSTGAWTYAVHAHPEQAAPILTYALNGPGTGQTGSYHLYVVPLGA